MQNYGMLIERISKVSGLEREEIEKRVEAKRAKLSGLISKEGAAQIIAAELGVSFENIQIKVSEIMPGMRKVNLLGKILNVFPVREYNKNGKSGKIGSFVLADDSGNIRIVLWDVNHIALLEKEDLKSGDVVEISNASIRQNEVHLGSFSDIKKSNLVLDNVVSEKSVQERNLSELEPNQRVMVRGVIVQMYNPRFFHVCPECGKKAIDDGNGFFCNEHGKITPKERSLINFVLDDGSETVRVVMFSDQINQFVPEETLKDMEKLSLFKEDMLGLEVYISGLVKKNALFNNLEITAQEIKRVNVEELISQLEKK
jgi:replication factor A1